MIKDISCVGLLSVMASLSYAKTMTEDSSMGANMIMEGRADMVMDSRVESGYVDDSICYVFQNNQLSHQGFCTLSDDFSVPHITHSNIKIGSDEYQVEISFCDQPQNAEAECKFSLNAKDAEMYYRDLSYKEIPSLNYFSATTPCKVLACYRSLDAQIDVCYLD